VVPLNKSVILHLCSIFILLRLFVFEIHVAAKWRKLSIDDTMRAPE